MTTPMTSSPALAYCTTREAAQLLGVSLRTVQFWVDGGLLEAWKTDGGHRRIKLESVHKLLSERTGEPAASGPAPASPPLKVLVVEDDNILLKLYRARIEAWQLPVALTTAVNGYEALLLTGRERPDLMITDLNMPGIDGFQMVRALTASSFREGMEIIAITGLGPDEVKARGGLPEGVALLPKPIPFDTLKSLTESLLARRAAAGF